MVTAAIDWRELASVCVCVCVYVATCMVSVYGINGSGASCMQMHPNMVTHRVAVLLRVKSDLVVDNLGQSCQFLQHMRRNRPE